MPDKGWKAFERRLAKDVGTQRIPVTGERDGADFADWLFVYQAKKRKQFPTYVASWIESIEQAAARHGSIAVVVMQRPHHPDDDAVVAMSWRSWKRLLTYLKESP